MKKTTQKLMRAFTLVELLVVISIIALLLAILMPSLNKAREQGRKVVCLNHEKSLQLSNNVYANENGGCYVPVVSIPSNGPASITQDNIDPYTWLANLAFRKITGVKDAEKTNVSYSGGIELPDKFYCPSDEIARQHKKSDKNILVSFAYNVEDWWGMTGTPQNSFPQQIQKGVGLGYKQSQIKNVPSKINFIDSVDWWVIWTGANYSKAWDRVGQRQREVYADPAKYGITGAMNTVGPVLFRHSEGAVIAFYDGHAAYLKKDKVFVNTNPTAPLRNWKDALGIWSNK